MKKLIYIPLAALFLGACSDPSVEEALNNANERNEELQGLLQTEEVNLQKNNQKLEALEDDISKMQSVIDNPDINIYVSAVEDYAEAMSESLEALGALPLTDEDADFSEMESDTRDIASNIRDAIDDYNQDVADIEELDEYLERQHRTIEIANEDISTALDSIVDGVDRSSPETVEEGLALLRSAHEYY